MSDRIPENLKLLNKYRLTVRQPDEPSNALWENLEISRASYCCRKFIVFILVVLMMALSSVAIYYIKTFEDDIPKDDECEERGVDDTIDVKKAEEEYTTTTDSYCWCKQ